MFLCSLIAFLSTQIRPRPEPVSFDGLLDELFEAWPLEPWENATDSRRAA